MCSQYSSEARVLFRAGKNRDGYFTADDLVKQVDLAIDIFESKTNGTATGLFLFDNAPSHQKRSPDALSARKMVKGPSLNWTRQKGGPHMRPGTFADGTPQYLYFPEDHPEYPGWFKGMEVIIRERSLWPETGLHAECKGFKCEPGATACCCRRLLFNQPDFIAQKSQLEELVTRRGHICDFYPKFHPELNFIEQYWGLSKHHYRLTPSTHSTNNMEKNVLISLDAPSVEQIRR
jgi:hypothetical protein